MDISGFIEVRGGHGTLMLVNVDSIQRVDQDTFRDSHQCRIALLRQHDEVFVGVLQHSYEEVCEKIRRATMLPSERRAEDRRAQVKEEAIQ